MQRSVISAHDLDQHTALGLDELQDLLSLVDQGPDEDETILSLDDDAILSLGDGDIAGIEATWDEEFARDGGRRILRNAPIAELFDAYA